MQSESSSLPIIDIGPYLNQSENRCSVAQKVRDICKEIGFFYIKNHGVPTDLQKSLLQNSSKFFSLPKQQKYKIHMNNAGLLWRGYFEVGQEYTSGKIDLKQGLYLGQQHGQDHHQVIKKTPLHGANLYPEQLPELKNDILKWLDHMSKIGNALMEVIAESLHLDRYFFRDGICSDHTGLLRLFHYPVINNNDPNILGVGQHTDYGLVTILMINEEGLQVKDRKDKWIQIDPIPNTFVINIGDILQKITKGLYKSTPHKVINTSGKSRYSIPYFYDPSWNAELKELNIDVSENEKELQKKTHEYKRWDNMSMQQLKGTYNKYLISKLVKVFPELAKVL